MKLALVLLALLAVACGSTVTPTGSSVVVNEPSAAAPAPTETPTTSPTAGATPTATPSASPTSGCGAVAPAQVWDVAPYACTGPPAPYPLPEPGTKLSRATYTTVSFNPTITFTVGKGWTAAQAAPGFFDIEDEPGSLDVVAVQFANVVGVSSASEALAEVSESSDLSMTFAETVTIDGREALQVVVQTTDAVTSDPPIFRPVLNVPPGLLSIASGRRLQITVLDVEGGVLAILVGGSIADWDHALEVGAPVVDSVTID
ncbi:MAG: hypothetical protein ABIP53_05625 [Candidatus Limnocylindrales bacterium]